MLLPLATRRPRRDLSLEVQPPVCTPTGGGRGFDPSIPSPLTPTPLLLSLQHDVHVSQSVATQHVLYRWLWGSRVCHNAQGGQRCHGMHLHFCISIKLFVIKIIMDYN